MNTAARLLGLIIPAAVMSLSAGHAGAAQIAGSGIGATNHESVKASGAKTPAAQAPAVQASSPAAAKTRRAQGRPGN